MDRGLEAGEVPYVIRAQEPEQLRRLAAELLVAFSLTTIRSESDHVDERVAQKIARIKEISDVRQIVLTLRRLALGGFTQDQLPDVLKEAETYVTLPFGARIPIGQILDSVRRLTAEMDSWA